MPAGNWLVYGAAVEGMAEGLIDLDTHAFRMVLCTSSYTPNQSTHATWADASAAEVANGNGYATHGQALTYVGGGPTSRSGLVLTFNCDDVSWPTSTITAKYAVIVRDADSNGALASTDPLLCYVDLETGGGSLSTTNGTLTVTINASGVFTITAS